MKVAGVAQWFEQSDMDYCYYLAELCTLAFRKEQAALFSQFQQGVNDLYGTIGARRKGRLTIAPEEPEENPAQDVMKRYQAIAGGKS